MRGDRALATGEHDVRSDTRLLLRRSRGPPRADSANVRIAHHLDGVRSWVPVKLFPTQQQTVQMHKALKVEGHRRLFGAGLRAALSPPFEGGRPGVSRQL